MTDLLLSRKAHGATPIKLVPAPLGLRSQKMRPEITPEFYPCATAAPATATITSGAKLFDYSLKSAQAEYRPDAAKMNTASSLT